MQTPVRDTPGRSSQVSSRRRRGPSDLTLLEDITTIITQSQDLRGALERIVEDGYGFVEGHSVS